MKKVIAIAACLLSMACLHAANTSSLSQGAVQEKALLNKLVDQVLGKNKVFLARNDIDMSFGGRVRQEGFYFDKPLTFREDYNDRYRFMRSKYNFDISADFGRRQFGESAVFADVRMTAFNVWDNFDVYTPTVAEPVSFSPQNFLKKAEISEHHHDGLVTQMYMEEGVVTVRLDKLLAQPARTPVALKAGYFPYQVGRGVSLGSYFDGAIGYLGWQTPGNPGNGTARCPGVELTLGHQDDLSFHLYYSKWRKRSHGPDFLRDETRAKRLDINDENTVEIQRGPSADRDLFAARLCYTKNLTKDKSRSLYLEPYGVFVNAPELEVELKGDASARIGTFGMMAEYKHDGWCFNMEIAGQVGHQQMHAIDRNHTVVDDAYYMEHTTEFDVEEFKKVPLYTTSTGRLDATGPHATKYQSHVLLGMRPLTDDSIAKSEYLPYRAYSVSDEYKHINANREVGMQGAYIRRGLPDDGENTSANASGQPYVSKKLTYDDLGVGGENMYRANTIKTGIDYYDTLFAIANSHPDGLLYNANIPFGGGTRYRKNYRLGFKGFMAMADLSYTLPDKSLTCSIAGAHISGDDIPFNKEENQDYRGFVPLKDADYSGRSVQSYAVLAARKIGRPTTFSDSLMHAPVNYESMTNLQFLGAGLVWRPNAKNRNLITLEANGLYFWEDCPPFKWDKTATRSFGSAKIDGLYAKAQSDLGFTGHQTDMRASKKLGFELNAVLAWRPLKYCELRFMLATFIPGQLYEDIDGMPTSYTVRQNKDGDWRFDSMGTQTPFGGMFRLTYWF